jgi:hypothetical protein
MSLIFDRFPSTEKAEAFVAEVSDLYGLDGAVFESQEDSEDRSQPIWEWSPVLLEPPIALIEGAEGDDDFEQHVIKVVEPYGGTYAGGGFRRGSGADRGVRNTSEHSTAQRVAGMPNVPGGITPHDEEQA